jgi:phage terminase large subunit-like protein
LPGQFSREHLNVLIDGADAFASAEEVDAAMSTGHREEYGGRRDVTAYVFVDFGLVSDPTAIALGYEEDGRVVIGRIITFQGSKRHPVQIAAVERTLRELAEQWRIKKIRIESWQGVASVQRLQNIGLPVEAFTPTAKAHSEEWPVLAQRLASRTLVCFPHAALREELLNLVYEVGASGVRVVDRGSVHQDHAVAVRGVCAQLVSKRRPIIAALPGYQSKRVTLGSASGAGEPVEGVPFVRKNASEDYDHHDGEHEGAIPDPGGDHGDYARRNSLKRRTIPSGW